MSSFFPDPMRVLWGSLELTDSPYGFEFGANFGAGENVYEEMAGLLADGETVSSDRTSNREFSFAVWVEAPSLLHIEEPEKALLLEADRARNTLTVYPGDGGTPFVLDTFRAQPGHDRSEAAEMAGMRRYEFTVKALPFSRSVEPVASEVFSAPPPPASPSVIVVDDGSSATNWAASYSGAISASDGSVGVHWNSLPRGEPIPLHFARNSTFSMAGTPYLRIEWSTYARPDYAWSGRVLTVNGVHHSASDIAYEERLSDGRFVSWIKVDAPTVTQVGVLGFLRLSGMIPRPGPIVTPPGGVAVFDISRADQIVTSGGTGHQVAVAIPVAGTARTQGSIHLWDAAETNLGDVLLYSGRKDGMISLDPFIATATTPITGTVSGTSKSLSDPVVYNIPATVFDPSRSTGYLLMGRLNNAGSGSLDTTLQSIVGVYGGSPILLGPQQVQGVDPTTGLDIACLGAFTVPPLRVDGPDAGLRVTLWQNSPAGAPFVDDLWLVDIESGSLTWVDRDVAAFGHLWVEAPTLVSPLPRVRIGAGPNGAVGWEAAPKSYGEHMFPAGEVHLYAVATEAAVSRIQTEYFPRGILHASGS